MGNFIYFFKPLKNPDHFIKDVLNCALPVIIWYDMLKINIDKLSHVLL